MVTLQFGDFNGRGCVGGVGGCERGGCYWWKIWNIPRYDIVFIYQHKAEDISIVYCNRYSLLTRRRRLSKIWHFHFFFHFQARWRNLNQANLSSWRDKQFVTKLLNYVTLSYKLKFAWPFVNGTKLLCRSPHSLRQCQFTFIKSLH